MKNFEKIIEEVSGKGNYQAFITFLVMLVSIPAAFMNTGSVFLAAVPDSRCYIPEIENSTAHVNITESAIRDRFVPWNYVSNRRDRCKRFVYNTSECIGTDLLSCVEKLKNSSNPPTVVRCDDGYLFDHNTFQSTIVSEWNLICGRISLGSASTSFYYVGMFIGSILGGILADRCGRLLVYRCGAVLSLLSGVAVGFAPNIYVFTFLRSVVACSSCAAAKVAVVYVVEICNESWRSFAGLSYTIGFGIGCMLLSVFAFFIRDWRTLEFATSSTFAVCVVVSFFVDKSPRWVYVQGDKKEAKKICLHIAKRNGQVVSNEMWDQFGVTEDEKKEKKVESKNTLKEMLIRPYTRLLLLSNMFVWMTTSLVYYGLALNSGALAGDIYINNAAGGLMELMAAIVSGPAIAKFGCRNSVVFSEFLASFACLLSTVAIQFAASNQVVQTLGVALAMIGRFGVSAAWAVMYLHTPALFPTPGRSSALGASSMASRIGSIITPFTLQLQYNIPWLTQTVFGIGAFIVACLCTLYPETHGKPMTSTYDEAELRFKRHITSTRLFRCICCYKSGSADEDYKAEEDKAFVEEKVV